ncbi:hypothetical protein IPH25_00610 [bacterium]|nr:MAG: hypothetical protein IPG37_02730 [bacterium]QQR61933.1 MAG: hypothetical protein IPH25_00610 [bacterium]QQR62476.1 MAG: hypothetical protein IPH67_03570 [bacterium]
MVFSKIYACASFCLLAHMFVVSMDTTVHEGSWRGPFALEDFRELQVLDGLSLYCYDKHFYEKFYVDDKPIFAKSKFQIATDVPLDVIKELEDLASRFLGSTNDIPTLEVTLLTAKYCSTLKRINFWYGACKNHNYNQEEFFAFFKNMAEVYKVFSPQLRKPGMTEYYAEDALMVQLESCTKGLANNEKVMLSSMLLLPARYTKIKTNPHYPALHDKLYNHAFTVLPFIRLFNMFLIEKYYQEKYPAVFAQLSQSNPITSNLEEYTVDEVECLQRLKVINLCILDLGERIKENKIKYMEKLLEDGKKNQNNAFSDRWFMLKTKCKLLNELINKKGFMLPRFFLSPVLRFMIGRLEDPNGNSTIKFAYPSSFNVHHCYVEFLDTLAKKIDEIGLQAYQKQKETLEEQLLHLDKQDWYDLIGLKAVWSLRIMVYTTKIMIYGEKTYGTSIASKGQNDRGCA